MGQDEGPEVPRLQPTIPEEAPDAEQAQMGAGALIEKTPNGPFTQEEARALNALGTATGGCADCVDDAKRFDEQNRKIFVPRWALTQWKFDSLRQDSRWPHRFLCPPHFAEVKP